MKKILISIIISLTLGLSIFTFVACGGNGDCNCATTPSACDCTAATDCTCSTIPSACDCTPVTGCTCDTIPSTCNCTHGNIGCNCGTIPSACTCTHGNARCECTPTIPLRVHGLNDPFTYYSHTGLRLFTVEVIVDPDDAGRIVIRITGHNTAGQHPSALVRGMRLDGDNVFRSITFTSMIYENGTYWNSWYNNNISYIWFGTPTSVTTTSFSPVVKFNIS